MRGLLHRLEGDEANVVRLAHFFQRPADARIACQSLAAIWRPFKGGDGRGHGVAYLSGQLGGLQVKAGVNLLRKQRRGANIVTDVEDDDDEIVPSANFHIRERRYDPYLRLTLNPAECLTIDAGLRYEITRRRTTADGETARNDTENLNP